jgi:hypothetical protein
LHAVVSGALQAGGLAQSHVDPAFVAQFGEALELLRKVMMAADAGVAVPADGPGG